MRIPTLPGPHNGLPALWTSAVEKALRLDYTSLSVSTIAAYDGVPRRRA